MIIIIHKFILQTGKGHAGVPENNRKLVTVVWLTDMVYSTDSWSQLLYFKHFVHICYSLLQNLMLSDWGDVGCRVGTETINEHVVWQSIVSSHIVCHNERQPMPHLGHFEPQDRKTSMFAFLFTCHDGLSVVVVSGEHRCDVMHIVNCKW